MPLYFYQAFSQEGKKITGFIDAPSENSVKEQLTKKKMFPITIYLQPTGKQETLWQRLFARSVTTKEKILLTKQLAVLLKSGIPLLQALELLVDQFEGSLRSIIIQLKEDIKSGSSLAESMKKYPKLFNTIYIQLVRAGEASGKLEFILERLTIFLERQDEVARRIQGALRQPLIQLSVTGLVVVFLFVYVVPQMVATFSSQGKALPTPTQLLIDISGFLTNNIVVLPLVLLIAVVAFNYWRSSAQGARHYDMLLLKVPIVGYFARVNAIIQFSRTLGMLIEGGVNLSESLDIVVNIIDNKILADTLHEARDKIIKQGKIAQYLKQTGLFPPMAIYLIKTGEESGQLDFMLLTIAQNYEIELQEFTDSLSEKIQPLLLVVMGIIVGFIVLSIMLPIVQMGDVASSM